MASEELDDQQVEHYTPQSRADSQLAQLDALMERATVIRKQRGYGRITPKSLIHQVAQYGPVTVIHTDADGDEVTLESVHDVEPILEANRRLYNDSDRHRRGDRWKLVARIGLGEIEKMYRAGINPFTDEGWEFIKAKLDSPEWLGWRTAPGRLSSRPHREHYAMSGNISTSRKHRIGEFGGG